MAFGQWAWVSALLVFSGFAACRGESFGLSASQAGEGGAEPSTGGSSTRGGGASEGGAGKGSSAGSPTGGNAAAGNASAGNATVLPGEAGAGDGGQGSGNPVIRTGPLNVGHSEFHDSASGSDNASSHLTDATFVKPPGTMPGDLLLVFFGCDHQLNNLGGSELKNRGWELLDQEAAIGTDGQGTYLIYRFADGTEPDSIVFKGINEPNSGNGVQGLLTVYRGVNRNDPINAYEVVKVEQGSENTKHITTPTPPVTTTVDNCLLIAGLSPDTAVDQPKITAWPEGFDQNRISVVNPSHPYPFGWANIYAAERPQAQAGKVAASRFAWDITYDGSTYSGALSFVLALAPQ